MKKIDLDTQWPLECERCERIIEALEPKVIAGFMVNSENWLLCYCAGCWHRTLKAYGHQVDQPE